MVVKSKVLFCVIILGAVVKKSCCWEIDYLGEYLTDEEYHKRDVCSTKICMIDNDRLVYAATRNSSVKPCDDIRTFAAGEFLKHRVLNDRYRYIGFQNDVNRLTKERQRTMLKKPIKDSEPRMFKIMKNFFRKCVNSALIRDKAEGDMISQLKKLGGSPLISHWSEVDFEVKNLFEIESYISMIVFLDQKLSRCNGPRVSQADILCFKTDHEWRLSSKDENDTNNIFKTLKLDEGSKATGVKDFIDFLLLKDPMQRMKNKEEPVIFTVRELNAKYQDYNLDWLNIINNQLLQEAQISVEDEILVENPELLQKLLSLLSELKPEKIANIFATTFFYSNKQAYVVYSFSRYDASIRGTKQSIQRYEQCIFYLENTMGLAMNALTAEKHYDPSLQAAGRELITEAISDVINEVKVGTKISNGGIKKKVISKLESIRLIAMFPEEALNATKIQDMYKELTIDGSESLVEMYLAIGKHNLKLSNEKMTNWKSFLEKILKNYRATYDVDQNVMYVRSDWFLYPWYHPERSRFFNMATLYAESVDALSTGISRYLQKEANQTIFINNAILADENYVRWELNGGKERELNAFKLSNRQMLWVCFAYRYISKYHEKVPPTTDAPFRFLNENFHIFYKNLKNFRDAFMCEDMTNEENIRIKELEKKYSELYKDFSQNQKSD